MIRSEETVLANLVSADDVAVAAALAEIKSSERPITAAVRGVVERIAGTHASSTMRELARAVIAVADATARINRARKTWGATLNPLLLAAVLANPSAVVRRKALETVKTRETRPYGEVVGQALREEPEPPLVLLMLEILASTKDPSLMPYVDPLVDRPDPAIAQVALETLLALAAGEIGPALAARLETIATAHACTDVRFLARSALAAGRGQSRAPEAEAGLTAVALAAALAHPSAEERLAAVERAAAARAHPGPIATALHAEQDVRVLARMVSVLRELGGPEHADAVRPLLRHPDDRVCANAVEALVQLNAQVSVESLLPLLARDDNRLKANLMVVLRDRYPMQVAGYVRRMLRSPKFSFRVSGLYCARYMDTADIYPDVLAAVSEETHPHAVRAGLAWLAEQGPIDRARTDLADLALVRPTLAGEIQGARTRLEERARPEPHAEQRTPVAGVERPASRAAVTPVRAVTRPDRSGPIKLPPPRAPWYEDRRLLGALAGGALVAVACAALALAGDRREAAAPARVTGRVKAHPAVATPLRGLITRVAGPPEALIVDVAVRNRSYTVRWPPAAPVSPAVGQEVLLGSLTMMRAPDGSAHLTAQEVAPAH